MEYLALDLHILPRLPFAEIIIYHLSENGFEMFEDTEDGINAFIPLSQYNEKITLQLIEQTINTGCEIEWNTAIIPDKNWNEEWERNFQPQIIGNRIYVRADFHAPNPSFQYEIVVQPKMAFGTGHHATTSQVMEQMLTMDFNNKSVLDMGSGTGILAILAAMLGANPVCAVDIDPVCVESSFENTTQNGFPDIEVIEGVAEKLKGRIYNIILANINRNIILNDLPFYADMLFPDGIIIMSGFYLADLNIIRQKAELLHLNYQTHTLNNDWCCAVFRKA